MIGKYTYLLCDGERETYLKAEEAREWCREVFGEEYTGRWGAYINGFNFNNEKDYMLFLVRWS
jgi:hypothetical protein